MPDVDQIDSSNKQINKDAHNNSAVASKSSRDNDHIPKNGYIAFKTVGNINDDASSDYDFPIEESAYATKRQKLSNGYKLIPNIREKKPQNEFLQPNSLNDESRQYEVKSEIDKLPKIELGHYNTYDPEQEFRVRDLNGYNKKDKPTPEYTQEEKIAAIKAIEGLLVEEKSPYYSIQQVKKALGVFKDMIGIGFANLGTFPTTNLARKNNITLSNVKKFAENLSDHIENYIELKKTLRAKGSPADPKSLINIYLYKHYQNPFFDKVGDFYKNLLDFCQKTKKIKENASSLITDFGKYVKDLDGPAHVRTINRNEDPKDQNEDPKDQSQDFNCSEEDYLHVNFVFEDQSEIPREKFWHDDKRWYQYELWFKKLPLSMPAHLSIQKKKK
jgi:hypothetical protein